MASHLPHSRLRTKADLVVLRRVLGWQSPGYDSRVRCSAFPLTNLQPGEIVFFSCYAVAGLVLPMYPFLLSLLEFYGLQLHHLSPHSLILVAIFVHFYEVFICVRPSVTLFRLFHTLRWAGKGTNPIVTYYFQLRAKPLAAYIMAITLGKWDR
jgi:hypothetical protein